MKKILFAVLFVCLGIGNGLARDVYVYQATTSNPIAVISNVRSIAFSDGSANFVSENGASQSLSLDAFDYILTYNSRVVGIKSAKVAGEAEVSNDGRNVSVKINEVVDKVEVYSTDGVCVLALTPKAKESKFRLAANAAGVYVVKAYMGKKVYTKDIIVK